MDEVTKASMAVLPIHILYDKVRQIQEEIHKLEGEKKHIEWVLENCTPPADLRVDESVGIRLDSFNKNESRKRLILDILKQKGPLRSSEIFMELSSRGIDINRQTFDWLMHVMARDKDLPLLRLQAGLYAHALQK